MRLGGSIAATWIVVLLGVVGVARAVEYRGSTAQGQSASMLTGRGGRLVHLDLTWRGRCHGRATFHQSMTIRFKKVVRRSFRFPGGFDERQGAYRIQVDTYVSGRKVSATEWRGEFSADAHIDRAGHEVNNCTLARESWHVSTPSAELTMRSGSGDFIGGGLSYHYRAPGVGVLVQAYSNYVQVEMGGWTLDFSSAHGRLRRRVYRNAMRYPFNDGHPGLSIYGDGRGCNTDTGSFTVDAFSLSPRNVLERFKASFVQHCEGAPAALRGTFSYLR